MTSRERTLLLRLIEQAATMEDRRASRMRMRPTGSHTPEAIEAAQTSANELWALYATVESESRGAVVTAQAEAR